VTTVSITAHELSACAIPDRGATDPSPFRLTLTALGPFPASGTDVERDLGLGASGHALSFNSATIGVDAVASNTAGAGEGAFIGHSERRHDDRIDVSLWPEQTACEVVSADGGYPGTAAGQALGFSARSGLSLVAGENAGDQRSGSSLVFATDTGEAGVVPRDRGTLRVSRAFATVTEFGDGLLVAGGTNPAASAATEDAAGTAEVFDPALGGFEPTLVELWSRRTHHAAVTLATTGETLLVGGLAPDAGSSGPGQLIRQFEAVSPSTKSSSISGLSSLDLGRVDPVALVLTNGRILVGGGYTTSGDERAPVGQIEAFSADATARVYRAELPARENRVFAALPGGGAVSVASCRNEPAARRAECSCFTASGAPCPANDPDQAWLDAWWIDPSGTPTAVTFEQDGVLAACASVDTPLLAAGSDGAPWLVFAHADGTPACVWRFQAWPAVSEPSDPASRPRFVMTALTLEPSPDARSGLLGFGPDAFTWIGAQGGLFGARFGQRGPLTRDFSLLLSAFDAPFRPAHLVPDRDVTRAAAGGDAPAVAFERVGNQLTLAPVEPSVTVWVTDTLYDGVALSLAVEPTSDGSVPALPVLVFQSPAGATSTCAWNAPPLDSASTTVTVTASRHDTRVTLSAPNAADAACDVPPGPLALGIRAGSAAVTLGEFQLSRLFFE
jgi:hypothetical protein